MYLCFFNEIFDGVHCAQLEPKKKMKKKNNVNRNSNPIRCLLGKARIFCLFVDGGKKNVVLHTKGKDVVVQTIYELEYMFCGTDFDT